MKNLFILLLIGISLNGCSHAYARKWGNGEITACCPTHKLACKQKKLDQMAEQYCRGPYRAVGGESIDSGVATYGMANTAINGTGTYGYGQAQFNGNANTSSWQQSQVTHDMCVTYQCSPSEPAKAVATDVSAESY